MASFGKSRFMGESYLMKSPSLSMMRMESSVDITRSKSGFPARDSLNALSMTFVEEPRQ